MQKVRILFLPTVDNGNTNAQSLNTREIALRLDPQQFEITLLYRFDPDPRLGRCNNIRLLRLPPRRKTLMILREMYSGYNLIGYMDYSPASYIFVHTPRMFRSRTKTILHVEGLGTKMAKMPRMFSYLYEGVIANCDAYTAITDAVARDTACYLPSPAKCVLPVGVDLTSFLPSEERAAAPVTVLFAGTLTKEKYPLDVVEAAVHFPKAKFRLIGPGRGGHEVIVQRRITELGLNNTVVEGPRSQADLAQAMRESDIFLLPSRVEGLPKVTLEAAASGLPVILFRDYEAPSVVNGVTGFQVSTFEEMLEKLHLLITNRELRRTMGAAARKHAQQFDWGVVGRCWQEAYLRIASES